MAEVRGSTKSNDGIIKAKEALKADLASARVILLNLGEHTISKVTSAEIKNLNTLTEKIQNDKDFSSVTYDQIKNLDALKKKLDDAAQNIINSKHAYDFRLSEMIHNFSVTINDPRYDQKTRTGQLEQLKRVLSAAGQSTKGLDHADSLDPASMKGLLDRVGSKTVSSQTIATKAPGAILSRQASKATQRPGIRQMTKSAAISAGRNVASQAAHAGLDTVFNSFGLHGINSHFGLSSKIHDFGANVFDHVTGKSHGHDYQHIMNDVEKNKGKLDAVRNMTDPPDDKKKRASNATESVRRNSNTPKPANTPSPKNDDDEEDDTPRKRRSSRRSNSDSHVQTRIMDLAEDTMEYSKLTEKNTKEISNTLKKFLEQQQTSGRREDLSKSNEALEPIEESPALNSGGTPTVSQDNKETLLDKGIHAAEAGIGGFFANKARKAFGKFFGSNAKQTVATAAEAAEGAAPVAEVASEAGEGASLLGRAAGFGGRLFGAASRFVGRVAAPITAGLAAKDVYEGYHDDSEVKKEYGNTGTYSRVEAGANKALSNLTFGMISPESFANADKAVTGAVSNFFGFKSPFGSDEEKDAPKGSNAAQTIAAPRKRYSHITRDHSINGEHHIDDFYQDENGNRVDEAEALGKSLPKSSDAFIPHNGVNTVAAPSSSENMPSVTPASNGENATRVDRATIASQGNNSLSALITKETSVLVKLDDTLEKLLNTIVHMNVSGGGGVANTPSMGGSSGSASGSTGGSNGVSSPSGQTPSMGDMNRTVTSKSRGGSDGSTGSNAGQTSSDTTPSFKPEDLDALQTQRKALTDQQASLRAGGDHAAAAQLNGQIGKIDSQIKAGTGMETKDVEAVQESTGQLQYAKAQASLHGENPTGPITSGIDKQIDTNNAKLFGHSTPSSGGSSSGTPSSGGSIPTGSQSSSGVAGLIGRGESKGGQTGIFNMGAGHKYKVGHFDADNTTVGELMRRQALPANDPNKIFAAGTYQVIPGTMKAAAKALNLDPNAKFDKQTQDRIFTDYLAKTKQKSIGDYVTGKSDNLDKAQAGAAGEWASVQDKNGRGHYDKDGINHASIKSDEIRSGLQQARQLYQDRIKAGDDPQTAERTALLGIKDPSGKTAVASNAASDTLPNGMKMSGAQIASRDMAAKGVGVGPGQTQSAGQKARGEAPSPIASNAGDTKTSPTGYGGNAPELKASPGRRPDMGNVDPRLKEIMAAAQTHLPAGYTVGVNEGYNAQGHVANSQHHIAGKGALDVAIRDPKGNVIPNEGGDPTGMYHKLAQGAYGEMLTRHPELKGQFAWGGAFGASRTNAAQDLMHFDIGGERGNKAQFMSTLGPLADYVPGAKAPANQVASNAQQNSPSPSDSSIASAENKALAARSGANTPSPGAAPQVVSNATPSTDVDTPVPMKERAFGNYLKGSGVSPTRVRDDLAANDIDKIKGVTTNITPTVYKEQRTKDDVTPDPKPVPEKPAVADPPKPKADPITAQQQAQLPMMAQANAPQFTPHPTSHAAAAEATHRKKPHKVDDVLLHAYNAGILQHNIG